MPPRPDPRRLPFRARARSLSSAALVAPVAFAAAVSLAPGVSNGPLRQPPPAAPGFPIPIPRTVDYRPRWGATIATDLDHDGRSELLASVPSGSLFLIDRGGGKVPGWPLGVADLPWPAYPVGRPGTGDLDGDGQDEVVACVNAGFDPRRVYLVAWRRDGTRVAGWPFEIPTTDPIAACSPGGTLVADLDCDGRADVAQSIHPSEIWMLDGEGRPLPGTPFRPPVRATGVAPAINAPLIAAKLEDGGRLAVIAVESGLRPLLHAVTAAGAEAPHYPRMLPEIVDLQAPAAADLDGDGFAEIVQATLPISEEFLRPPPIASRLTGLPVTRVESTGSLLAPAGALHSLRVDGSEAAGWPVPIFSEATGGALLIDLDGDGRREVLQGDGDTLHGFDARGEPLNGFPLIMRRLSKTPAGRLDSDWLAADLDRDGSVDFLRALGVLDGSFAQLRIAAIRSRGGGPLPGTPWTLGGLLPASDPAIVDLTGDGRPEVALLATDAWSGGWRLMAWDLAAARGGGGAAVRQDRAVLTVIPSGPIPR